MQDIDAVISEAAGSNDADVLLEGVSVASRVAACNGVWLERQRDEGWAALWAALAALDAPRFQTAIAASDTLMGVNAGCAANACLHGVTGDDSHQNATTVLSLASRTVLRWSASYACWLADV